MTELSNWSDEWIGEPPDRDRYDDVHCLVGPLDLILYNYFIHERGTHLDVVGIIPITVQWVADQWSV